MKKKIFCSIFLFLSLVFLVSCSSKNEEQTTSAIEAESTVYTEITREWEEWLGGVKDHSPPLDDTNLLFAEIQKQVAEMQTSLDDRLLCLPKILKKSPTSSVSVKLKVDTYASGENAEPHILECFCQESIKSSETNLRYTPFVVYFCIRSKAQMRESSDNIDRSVFQEYSFGDVTCYLSTEVQWDGAMVFNMFYYTPKTSVACGARGCIYPTNEPSDIVAEKIYQDFACVPLEQ